MDLLRGIRQFFNRRTRAEDSSKEAKLERRTLAIENGEAAKRLMENPDFALMFNLYRFDMLNHLEDSKTDEERISNAYMVAGVRDFVSFVEKLKYLGRVAQKSAET